MNCCDVRTNSPKQYHKECMKNITCGEDVLGLRGLIANSLMLSIVRLLSQGIFQRAIVETMLVFI